MFRELNRQLRKLFLAVGALAAATAILSSMAEKERKNVESRSHEFDDIW